MSRIQSVSLAAKHIDLHMLMQRNLNLLAKIKARKTCVYTLKIAIKYLPGTALEKLTIAVIV